MSFKIAEKVYQEADSKFEGELLKEVERLAKAVIESHPKAKSFCMAMGSASFGCEWVEVDDEDPTDTWERQDNLIPHELADGNSFATDLASLLNKYDRKFCLTGCPMRIVRDNVSGELLTQQDW
jgi:hypothetical protein